MLLFCRSPRTLGLSAADTSVRAFVIDWFGNEY